MDVPTKYTRDEARNLITQILEQGGRIYLTDHCRNDSMRTRTVFTQDIEVVLEEGTIRKEPEWNSQHNNWTYAVEGIDLDNDELTVITVIIVQSYLIRVVTVF